MPEYEYDLFVIGGGSGGVRAGRVAASLGARVGMAESDRMGGTCVNIGCVPKKLFSYASHFHEEFEDAIGFGWAPHSPRFNWRTLVERKNTEIARLNKIYTGLMDRAEVEIFPHRAVITGPHEVFVNNRRISTERILIAVGGKPWLPEFPGVEHVWVSDDVFELAELPKRIVIAGGGYIACEFASIFNGLGVHVDLAYRGDLILRGFDLDVRHHVANEMRKKGVHLHYNAPFKRVEAAEDGLKVHLEDGAHLPCCGALFAIGRRPNTQSLGLEDVGVTMKKNGAIEVNSEYQTSVPSIYAVGDVIDRIQLTPVALAEGMFVAHNLFGHDPRPVDYDNVATAVFTSPNIGTVGLSEERARAHYPDVAIFKSSFRPMKHTLSGRDEKTFMKLVVDRTTDRVVGCHMVGPDAGELIQGISIAINCGATKAQFDATIGIHPTAAEEFVTMRTEFIPLKT